MEITDRRKLYLDNLKSEARVIWAKIVEDYNNDVPVTKIAKKYKSPRTGKHYHPQYIYAIIKQMRQANKNIS